MGECLVLNKLLGFYELKKTGLPTVKWEEFTRTTQLTSDKLWTIRCGVYQGDDTSLPRSIGKCAEVSQNFALSLLSKLQDSGVVIYYPFFKALKSGTILISNNDLIIEAVNDDLRNLTDGKNPDYINKNNEIIKGKNFLTKQEFNLLQESIEIAKRYFNSMLLDTRTIYLEWSFAQNVNSIGDLIGSTYLVFYEAKAI